jgi:uncharacterized protein (DUF2141 family)
MTSLESLFGTDTDLEKDGVWENFGSASFLIASALPGNPEFAKAQERVFRQKRRQIEADAVSVKQFQEITVGLYADAVVKDWKGVTFKGQPLPYSRENVVMVLTALPALLDAIGKVATTRSTYQTGDVEADAKN